MLTSINTGLLAEHTVTKIFAHKICSIYTHTKKKNWGELDGDARWSPRQMKDEIFWEGKEKSDSCPIGLEVGE